MAMVASIVKSPTVALFFLLLHQLQQDIKISPPPIYHIKNERTNIDETLRPRGAVSSLNCHIFLLLFILKEVFPHFSTHSPQCPLFFYWHTHTLIALFLSPTDDDDFCCLQSSQFFARVYSGLTAAMQRRETILSLRFVLDWESVVVVAGAALGILNCKCKSRVILFAWNICILWLLRCRWWWWWWRQRGLQRRNRVRRCSRQLLK